jgi:hypothetical protein
MFALVVLLTLSPTPRQSDAADAILKRLVFNCQEPAAVATAERDSDITTRLRAVDERCNAFRARIPPPRTDSAEGLAANARWLYAQRLFAMSTGDTAAEATRYATALHPCYEWEGYHDCPEHEAVFADTYSKDHPTSPLAQYLPLLAAHRWQCAAEAYAYEQRNHVPAGRGSVGMAEARRRAAADLATALRCADPLVRHGAETLKRTGSCV